MRRVHGGIGIVLIAFSLLVQLRDYWDLVPFVIGAILLWTAIVRYCPVNAALRRPAL
jgi:hypothetical protein